MNRIEKVGEIVDEILKDADVMQHVLYHPLLEVKKQERERYSNLVEEFNLGS